MAQDLIRPIIRALTPSATGLLARQLGESLGVVRTGLDAAVGSALRALTSKAETDAGAQEVLSVLRDSQSAGAGLLDAGPRSLEERLRSGSAATPHATATAAVDRVFSGRRPGLIDHLASFARIKRASAGSLVELGTTLALAALNDAGAVANGPAGLRKLLRSQSRAVGALLPRGFDPDLGGAPARGGAPRWAPWLLSGLLLLVLTGLGLRACAGDKPGGTVETVKPTPGPSAPPTQPGPPEAVSTTPRELPAILGAYLASPEPAPRTFAFEALEFWPGSSRLTPEAEATLAEVGGVLRARPGAAVRLEGHTDELGDPAGNQRLSEARAAAVADALIAGGVNSAAVSSLGFGETRPIAPDNSPEGRATNRRTELVVVRK